MAKKIKVCYKGDTSPERGGYFDDVEYLKFMIDYWCLPHCVIKDCIKICHDYMDFVNEEMVKFHDEEIK